MVFDQDNAIVHMFVVALSEINELGHELVPNPTFSPELGPSDYFRFPNSKKWFFGKGFGCNCGINTRTNAWFLAPRQILLFVRNILSFLGN